MEFSIFKKFGQKKTIQGPIKSFQPSNSQPRVVDDLQDYGYGSEVSDSDDESSVEEWFVEEGEIHDARERRLEQWARIEELFWKHGVADDPWATVSWPIEGPDDSSLSDETWCEREDTDGECWSQIMEVGDNLVDYALQLVEENETIINEVQFDEVESLYERLQRTREDMDWRSGDTGRARLLKARIFLQEASGFARRILFMSDTARTDDDASDDAVEALS